MYRLMVAFKVVMVSGGDSNSEGAGAGHIVDAIVHLFFGVWDVNAQVDG